VLLSSQRDNRIPIIWLYTVISKSSESCLDNFWTTKKVFLIALFRAERFFYVAVTLILFGQLLLNGIGNNLSCAAENISVNISGDVYITMSKMIADNFQVNAHIQKHGSVAMSEFMKC